VSGFLAPIVSFDTITVEEMNACLVSWGHRMGALRRPMGKMLAHGLHHNGALVAVVGTADLINGTCAGLSRAEAIELARLCAIRPDLCRPALRLWREFVFPALGREWAVSYQDEALHSGNTYRFDGWVQLGRSSSGPDRRSGRPGRSKTIWGWHCDAAVRTETRERLAA
jgi:hypothetical protein